MLTYDRLDELFVLDWNGWFYNRFSRGRAKEGDRAGSLTGHGYRKVCIDGVRYYEHHLVWFYVHGEWVEELDHKDGDGTNNAPANLRPCNRTQNNFNSQRQTGESGLKGAYLDKRNNQWYSKIQIGGRVKFLGNFDSAQEAHEAFMAAVELHHGEFAYHNRNIPKET